MPALQKIGLSSEPNLRKKFQIFMEKVQFGSKKTLKFVQNYEISTFEL